MVNASRRSESVVFQGWVDRFTWDEWRAARARRDACAAHEFIRVQREPPKWYCPHCKAAADQVYVRAFERGVIAAGADPRKFIADYGEWP